MNIKETFDWRVIQLDECLAEAHRRGDTSAINRLTNKINDYEKENK